MCFLKLQQFDDRTTAAIQHAVHRERLDIQAVHTGPSRRKALSKYKTSHCFEESTLLNCLINNPELCQETYVVYESICSKCSASYIRSTTRKLHIRIKEYTQANRYFHEETSTGMPDREFTVHIRAWAILESLKSSSYAKGNKISTAEESYRMLAGCYSNTFLHMSTPHAYQQHSLGHNLEILNAK